MEKRGPKPKVVQYKSLNESEELFLRKTVDYVHNCADRIKFGFSFGARANLNDLRDSANALIEHGELLKKKFGL